MFNRIIYTMIKNNYEISQIKKACLISCRILSKCIKLIPNFKYEYEIKNYLESEAKKLRYKLAFTPIVASSKNAAKPHYDLCRSKLKRGFLVIDFGIKVNGYCSDMTRTLFLGKPTKNQIKIYNKVLNVQKKCIEMFRKNKKINIVGGFAKKELGKEFIHSLGHGIGLKIHESPKISFKTKKYLQNNVCFTIEPGIYRKGKFGIRIEDSLVKKNNKIKVLTPLTKKLIIINKKVYK